MRFGILGPLVVWRDGRELRIGAAKQRALLTLLLLRRGELVPTETLLDGLWGERPPATGVKVVQVYVSQLRKALGGGLLETRPAGYLLRLEPGALDAERFEGLLERARGLLSEGDASAAGDVLRAALALWRGPPLAEFRYEAFAREAIGRLEELRLAALELRLEADLALGRHTEAVPELETLVREQPLRETLRELLMLALYRAGRQADALAAYQDARATLVGQLGLDPGQSLQRLEQAILQHDPALDLTPRPPPPTAEPEPPPGTPAQLVCASCGHANSEGARFCEECGLALAAVPPGAKEQRKTVTVLFCDLTSSTALGETLDPEQLRALLARYFERMKTIVERHGGSVEKFIGDAVMAIFGVPVLHEDDALRALRSAAEMRDALTELGLPGRIGVMTGEVVTGTEERLATGDALNVAARLEQAAQPGEILIGGETYRLTRDAAEVETLEPLALKGKAEPVPIYRLLSVRGAEGFSRHAVAPMVGRGREQRQLASVWERTTSESACQLFTVLGAAGVGKSRLVAEFVARLEDALVVRARCLPYGEGITYWPVVEIVRQLPEARPDRVVAETISALLGVQQSVTSSEEIAWAFRKHLEVIASERPLVCVFDDLQWGEETFLDLVEHVADLSRDAPILLLCMARPDLLDRRTGWGGGKVNATTVLLEPLAPEEAERLIESLVDLDDDLRTRVLEAAEGNPLFVEEMAALIHESGGAAVGVPPTIQALLAARLDQLEAPERSVLQCGSIEGRIFHRGAVQALNPDETQLTARLTGLVRKELIRPDKAQLPGEDAFRFRHLLSRDAAYDALPKATRAELHERFAGWLEEHGADLVELDEMLGYHYEQAYRFKRELGQQGETLADRAASRLGVAGRRALDRGDMDGATNLLQRAASLIQEGDKARTELEVELAGALLEGGRLTEAESLLDEAVAQATRNGDRLLQAQAQVGLASIHLQTHGSQAHTQIKRDLEPLLTAFEEAEDHRGAADTLALLGQLARWDNDFIMCSDLHERALLHARRAGDERRQAAIIGHIVSDALWGPEHVEPALARCRALLDETSNRRVQADGLIRIGGLEGLAGRFDTAREAIARAREIMDDLGLHHLKAHSTDVAVLVEMLAGNHEAAEREARTAYTELEEMGDRTYQNSEAHLIARALEAQGRTDEAEEWLVIASELGDPSDVPDELALQAQIMARRGLLEDAERLARSALAQGSDEDPVPMWGDARLTLAQILAHAGRTDEARQAAEQCLRRYQAKGIVPLTESAQALLAEIPA